MTKSVWRSLFLPFFLATVCAVWLIWHLPAQDDIDWFRNWTSAAQQFGYSDLSAHSSFNYFPTFVPILALSNAGEGLLHSTGISLAFPNYWRLVHLVLELGLVFWLWRATRPLIPEQQHRWLAWLFLFNPMFIWVVWVWGQTDLLVVVPLLIGYCYLVQKKYAWFVSLSLFAILLKPTGALLMPFQTIIGLTYWLKHSPYAAWLTYGSRATLAGGAIMLPLLPLFARYFTNRAAWGQPTALTYNAFNFWFLLHPDGPAQRVWQGLSFQVWGGVLFLITAVVITSFYFYRLKRAVDGREELLVCLAYAMVYSFGCVFFLTDMHERYWDFVLGPLLLLALIQSRYRLLAVLLSGTFFVNLILIFPSTVPLFIRWQSLWFRWGHTLSWVHALAFVFTVILWAIWSSVNMPLQHKQKRIKTQPSG